MLFDEAVRYLLGLGHETVAVKLGLENIECLLRALGRPETGFPAVQIAGTNGKGSTALSLEAMCRAAGIRTGLYTSPHLVSITERIRIDGQEVRREEFARLISEVRRVAMRLVEDQILSTLPTFFEQVTAAALLAFFEARVELAILETGLGGRLDATTAAQAGVVAITQVALDHQQYLGETIEQIAAEKAAIIRPGAIAVISRQSPEALGVILDHGARCGVTPRLDECQIRVLGADATGRLRATFKTKQESYENVTLALRGRHQLINASTAIGLAEALRERGFPLSRAAIIEGLEEVRHPGRLEIEDGRPSLLYDGAHNEAGARALRDYLAEFVTRPVTMVFGAMRDKEPERLASLLFPLARTIILTQPANPRAAPPEMLAQAVPSGLAASKIVLSSSPAEALQTAFDLTEPDGLVCVTGSLYLVGEIKELLHR